MFPQRTLPHALPILISFLIEITALGACSTNLASSVPLTPIPTLAYCDLVRDPAKYDQVTVRVHTYYSTFEEGAYLWDYGCSEETWSQLIRTDRVCSVQLPTPVVQRTLRLGYTWKVTVVGRFRGNSNPKGWRYGPLGQYPFALDAQCLEAVSPPFVPSPRPTRTP